jgi:hypothetical protein
MEKVMLILHGIYDNGKVEITDDKKPAAKQEVQILLNIDKKKTKSSKNLRSFFNDFQLDLSHFKFNREEANER